MSIFMGDRSDCWMTGQTASDLAADRTLVFGPGSRKWTLEAEGETITFRIVRWDRETNVWHLEEVSCAPA